MGKRFVCDNGAISGEFFARVSFKHLARRRPPASGTTRARRRRRGRRSSAKGMTVIDRAPDDLHRFVPGSGS